MALCFSPELLQYTEVKTFIMFTRSMGGTTFLETTRLHRISNIITCTHSLARTPGFIKRDRYPSPDNISTTGIDFRIRFRASDSLKMLSHFKRELCCVCVCTYYSILQQPLHLAFAIHLFCGFFIYNIFLCY